MKHICSTIFAVAISAFGVFAQERPAVPAVPRPLEQPPQRPGLEIFAERMEADLKTKAILYSNKVVAIDQPLKTNEAPTILRCNTLTRTNDGKFDRIVAQGDVEIDQGDLHARGQLALYTSETERLEVTGPFGQFPLPMLYSTQGTNANSTVITNWGEKIVYDRRNGKLIIDKPVTVVPASTLSRGTNGGSLFEMKPRKEPSGAQTNSPVPTNPPAAQPAPTPAAQPARTNRYPFSTSPGPPPPRRTTDRKSGF
jgi:hypothetical protein